MLTSALRVLVKKFKDFFIEIGQLCFSNFVFSYDFHNK